MRTHIYDFITACPNCNAPLPGRVMHDEDWTCDECNESGTFIARPILEKADESMDAAFHCAGRGWQQSTLGQLREARRMYAELNMRQHVAMCDALLAEIAQRPAV